MIDDSNQKGLISTLLALMLVLISVGVVFYFLNYSPPKKQVIENREILKPLSSEPQPTKSPVQVMKLQTSTRSDIDIKEIPHDGRLFLALNLPSRLTKEKFNIFAKVSENSQLVYNLTKDNELDIKMEINEAEYNIKVPSGGTEGPCYPEEFGNQCGYKDEEIQTLSTIKIGLFRIWKKRNDVFLLNPVAIDKDDIEINHIEIYKIKPNAVFQEQEVNMWRDILKSVNFEKVT